VAKGLSFLIFMGKKISYKIGDRVGFLIYLGNDQLKGDGNMGHLSRFADFKCECGKIFNTRMWQAKAGKTKTCGCGRTKHGMSHTAEHNTWVRMKGRCYNKDFDRYDEWGGRGITVCDRWIESFENFFEDMGLRPTSNHSLDRYPDNNGNYEPNNCRWATPKEQNNNKSNNILVTYKNKTQTLSSWCEELKIPSNLVKLRRHRGWSFEKSFTTKNRLNIKIEYNGLYMNLIEWSFKFNIKTSGLRKYLKKHSFSDAYRYYMGNIKDSYNENSFFIMNIN